MVEPALNYRCSESKSHFLNLLLPDFIIYLFIGHTFINFLNFDLHGNQTINQILIAQEIFYPLYNRTFILKPSLFCLFIKDSNLFGYSGFSPTCYLPLIVHFIIFKLIFLNYVNLCFPLSISLHSS